MPLPATWYPVPDVGTARDQRSGADACAYPQISGLLWCRQFGHRQVRTRDVREVRRGHIRDLSEEAAAASIPRQAHGRGTRQRQIPPCRASQAIALQVSRRPDATVSATVQPAVGTYRASLEVGSPHGNAQSVLRHAGRSALSGLNLLRPLETSKFDASKIMRHYLRRYV